MAMSRVAILSVGLACLLLAGCGGQPKDAASSPAAKPGDGGVSAGAPAAPTAAGGPASSPGQATSAASPAAALDTSGWLMQPPFYAAGSEPDWRLDVADGYFEFVRSGLAPIETAVTQPKHEKAADLFSSPPLKITIKKETCETDNGQKTDASAVVNFDGVDFEGCAFSGHEAAGTPEASAVVQAIGVIDLCLAKLGDPGLVTGVYPREQGRTAVALRKSDGSQWECGVEPSGKEIAFLDPVEPGTAQPFMTAMRFLRDGVKAKDCPDAKEVRTPDNKVLGKMLAAKCKF